MTDVFDSFRESIIGEAFTESPLSERGTQHQGYMFGGFSTPTDTLAYTPDTWTAKTDVPQDSKNAAGMLFGAIIHVCGGQGPLIKVNDRYQDDAWTNKTDMPEPKRGDARGHSLKGSGYLFGGVTTPPAEGTHLDDTDQYNLDVDSWSSKTNMLSVRRSHGSFSVGTNGYSVGGLASVLPSVRMDDNDGYDPNVDTWTARTSLSANTSSLEGVGLGGAGYIFGGSLDSGFVQDARHYTVSADVWTNDTDMPAPARATNPHFVLPNDGHLFSAGGSSIVADVDRFDQSSWTSMTDLPNASFSMVGATLS